MLSTLKKFFSPDPHVEAAHAAYTALVSQARREFFYVDAGVPDTLDGRFDVIILHMFIATQRLKNDAPEFTRALWEVFFSDMDRSLREIGASDTGIGKRIKKIAMAFYGRMDAYGDALENDAAFKEAIARNLYRDEATDDAKLAFIADYARRTIAHLRTQDTQALASGNINFID